VTNCGRLIRCNDKLLLNHIVLLLKVKLTFTINVIKSFIYGKCVHTNKHLHNDYKNILTRLSLQECVDRGRRILLNAA